MKFNSIKPILLGVGASCLAVLAAHASQTTGLPYEDPLETIVESVTGPVAGAIGFLVIVFTGGALIIRGGEISDFGRLLLQLGIGIGVVIGSAPIMSSLFGFSGAEINPEYFELLAMATVK